jgi:hypothetical protein
MLTGDEPANLSPIAPPKMVLPMSLQLKIGPRLESIPADNRLLIPQFCSVNQGLLSR